MWPLPGGLASAVGRAEPPPPAAGQEQGPVGLVRRGGKPASLTPLPGHSEPACTPTWGLLAGASRGWWRLAPQARCQLGQLMAEVPGDASRFPSLLQHWALPTLHELRAVHSGYVAVGSGCGTPVFFSCALWALSPNAVDSNGRRLYHFSPLPLPQHSVFHLLVMEAR